MTMPVAPNVMERFRAGGLLFDGAIGSMLIAQGLATGTPPEGWNRTHADVVRALHAAYRAAGAEVITTNTFGGTRARLEQAGLDAELVELNRAAVRLARAASAGATLVALSLGPSATMLPPVGQAEPEQVRAQFSEQIACVADAIDLVLIETVFDLREGLLALAAVRAQFDGPVAVTMTFNRTPRGFFTMMGDAVDAALPRLQAAGADILGANCTLEGADMLVLAGELRAATTLPLLCQPNAGSPQLQGGVPVYAQTAQEFAADAQRLFERGVNAVGGCCGTTPDFIRTLAELRARGVR